MKRNRLYFGDWLCEVVFGKYSNNMPSISLFDVEDGSPVCVATVNLPEINVQEGHTLIKNYSENNGVLEALVKAGIVEDTGRVFPAGHVEANLVKIII